MSNSGLEGLSKSDLAVEAQQAMLVNRLLKEGFLKKAVSVFMAMKRPADSMVRSLLMSCLNKGDLPLALIVIRAPHVRPTLVHYTLAIKICTRVNSWAEVGTR